MFYENVRACCARHSTTLTEVLRSIGRSSGSTGSWKSGRLPNLEVVMEIANYLHVSLDEIVYGQDHHAEETPPKDQYEVLSAEQKEWLDVLSCIPDDRKQLCLDFLKTHMVIPSKYSDDKMA